MSSTVPSSLSLISTPAPVGEPRSPIPAPVEKRIDALDRAARRVRQSDADEDAIHDARVATRRLTAVLDIWKDQLAPGPRRKALRQLARARRRMGTAREHEVNRARLEKEIRGAPALTAEIMAGLAARLRGHGERDRARVADLLSHGRVEKIADRARRAVLRGTLMAWDLPEAFALATQRVERRRVGTLEALEEALAAPTDRALHEARVAAKKWRYGMEVLDEVRAGGQADPALSALRDLQERLGANQDRAVLARLLEREARRAAKRADVASLHALLERAAMLRAENLSGHAALTSSLERLRGEPATPPLP